MGKDQSFAKEMSTYLFGVFASADNKEIRRNKPHQRIKEASTRVAVATDRPAPAAPMASLEKLSAKGRAPCYAR